MEAVLRERWDDVVAATCGDRVGGARLFDELVERHGEPHRRYHTLHHLHEVTLALDELRAEVTTSAAVEYAVFFHDAVYDPAAPDNEERSAQLAVDRLGQVGVSGELAAATGRLVRLTATHEPAPDDADGSALCDADLWILAADEARYDEYVVQVRGEYAHVDDEHWRTGRGAVLDGFLARPRLYRAELARADWEPQARANLARERDGLR